ncbi:hypothetical protein CMI43_03520 [Candidatus Pacearchaeota archaeon]|jgi:hypothetical protein|nr:hypothetical protein [Candidatus Pacearchaeota archaeon]|tara:strand:+ start:4006 stop:4668 length:663 start_codon:yes stop_codon:yes gene_type:complete
MIKTINYDKDKQKINFTSDMQINLANAIRRSVLEIPIMAIDEVEITKNDSALYDEILAHRIGLIPIKTGANKEIKFKLQVKGPKIVVSGDFKPSTDAEDNLPIVLLDKDQEVEVVGEARLGKGEDHIKYSPGLMYYKHSLDEELLDYLHIGEDGKASYDEEEMKNKGLSDDKISKIKSFKEALELEIGIESWGQIEVKDIFIKAADVLSDNLKELDKAVK